VIIEFMCTGTRRLRETLSDRTVVLHRLRQALDLAALVVALYAIGLFMPEEFDSQYFFGKGVFPSFWILWTKSVVGWLTLPAFFALTVMGISLRVPCYGSRGAMKIC